MAGNQEDFNPIDSFDIPRFMEPATFMRSAYVKSLEGLDIALAGVPFDLGSSFRAGARHGPAQIREMSRLIRKCNSSSKISPFDICKIADIGDALVNPVDLMESIENIQKFYDEIHARGVTPVTAGGDHTITLPILRGLVKNGPIGCIQFDSHHDTWDEPTPGSRINNGTMFRRAVEEELIDPKCMVQIGLRGTNYSDNDLEYSYNTGMHVITIDDYEEMGRGAVIEKVRRVIGDGSVYLSFDMDGLDPVYCPGTGAPEPGGLSMRDAQVIIRGLKGLNLIGADVCEVAPPFDPVGHTALNAANIMFEILCIVADSISRKK